MVICQVLKVPGCKLDLCFAHFYSPSRKRKSFSLDSPPSFHPSPCPVCEACPQELEQQPLLACKHLTLTLLPVRGPTLQLKGRSLDMVIMALSILWLANGQTLTPTLAVKTSVKFGAAHLHKSFNLCNVSRWRL